ncbi:hypothetical protein Lal_00030088 [Lupinus albus]|nr:hypothetical protein Lal_00030088 [Lupinus albus]
MFTSIVGNVFGFKSLRALRLEDLRIPNAYVKTFQGPPHGIQVERDKLNKRDRFLFCGEALYKAQAETCEIKGHYLNAIAGEFTTNTSLAHYCRDNGLPLHIHRAMHVVIDRQKNHGSVANRVALEACVQDRNEGRDLSYEGNQIIREASKWSPELAVACDVWKQIKFEFQAMDTLQSNNSRLFYFCNSIAIKVGLSPILYEKD